VSIKPGRRLPLRAVRSARPRRGRVTRLVETQLYPAREGDGRQQAPALVADRPGDLDPLGLEGGYVVAE
jgi:hypothetical protein